MSKGGPSKPPPALAGCKVEQYAIRHRSMKYSGHSNLFANGKEVGPVPRLAIGRDERSVHLFHCDGHWNILGMAGDYASVRAAKERAERIYPGISKAWVKTETTQVQLERYLEEIGHNLKCSFCGRFWHQVDRIITTKDETAGICDRCVRKIRKLMAEPGK
jgi:hypothetical protein